MTNQANETVEVKTCDLIDEALDWAVAMSLGYIPAKREKRNWGYATVPAPELAFSRILTSKDNPGNSVYQRNFGFSNDCSQGSPIIFKEKICVDFLLNEQCLAVSRITEKQGYGPTPLIAAMRCFVASKLGDTVKIPKELLV